MRSFCSFIPAGLAVCGTRLGSNTNGCTTVPQQSLFLAESNEFGKNRCRVLRVTPPDGNADPGSGIDDNINEIEAESDLSGYPDGIEDDLDEDLFLRKELERIESLESIISELEDDDDIDVDIDDEFMDLFEGLPDDEELEEIEKGLGTSGTVEPKSAKQLENALLQGVVPAEAGVGSECLPGDWGFDPLGLASKDWIGVAQHRVFSALPGGDETLPTVAFPRPSALVLRDYREAEIRHGRLAMLAAVFWPLQEMLDRLLLDEDLFGSIIYSRVTLPYFPLLMTSIILLLGYLDVYSKAIKEMDEVGEAFLPGDCFWDPLKILQGVPDLVKRNMQEREILNGRMAMLAVACYVFEEATSHQPIILIEGNDLLFEPAYEIPSVQQWLDSVFESR